VFRAIIAGSVAAAVHLAAVGAPLFHGHLDGHHHDHHGAVSVHAHMGGHEAGHHFRPGADGSVVSADEESELATAIQLFVAAEPSLLAIPAPPPLRFTLPAPLESMVRRTPAGLHSHDPPSRQSGPSRAPPPFLS
jgi:hypothetical protein